MHALSYVLKCGLKFYLLSLSGCCHDLISALVYYDLLHYTHRQKSLRFFLYFWFNRSSISFLEKARWKIFFWFPDCLKKKSFLYPHIWLNSVIKIYVGKHFHSIVLQLLLHCLLGFMVATENSDANWIINLLHTYYFGGGGGEHIGELLESLLGLGFHQCLGCLGSDISIQATKAREGWWQLM